MKNFLDCRSCFPYWPWALKHIKLKHEWLIREGYQIVELLVMYVESSIKLASTPCFRIGNIVGWRLISLGESCFKSDIDRCVRILNPGYAAGLRINQILHLSQDLNFLRCIYACDKSMWAKSRFGLC